jgi:hypothetical protein
MSPAIAAFPDLESSVVVTTVALPTPQNPAASTVTIQTGRYAVLDHMQASQLDAVVQKNKDITGLLSEYLRCHSGFANSSGAVTYTAAFPIQMPKRYEVPARRTPFAHLNFLAPPVEGLYIDPDDLIED